MPCGSRPRISYRLSHSRADYRETRVSLRKKNSVTRQQASTNATNPIPFPLPLADTQTPRRPLEPLTTSRLVPASERNPRLSVLKPHIVLPSNARMSEPTVLGEKLVVANGDDGRRMVMMMHFGAYKTIKFWDLHSCDIRML